ncbi:MAG: hypothetical protein CMP39_05080 [Rickettsiales bacterium]|nr:hypothetical protein [Rickettsiales bacterium]
MVKAVFLDRDGVIIDDVNYLVDEKDVVVLPNVVDAIKIFRQFGFLVIVITNQSVVARGRCTEENVEYIHNHINSILDKDGAAIDAFYFCPHHPDFQYKGVTHCNCRKPEIGLFEQAVKRYNIDVSQSYFVGDKESDIQAGKKIGVQTVGVRTGYGCHCTKYFPDLYVDDLYAFSKTFL